MAWLELNPAPQGPLVKGSLRPKLRRAPSRGRLESSLASATGLTLGREAVVRGCASAVLKQSPRVPPPSSPRGERVGIPLLGLELKCLGAWLLAGGSDGSGRRSSMLRLDGPGYRPRRAPSEPAGLGPFGRGVHWPVDGGVD
ncbi:hypothetical protein JCM10135_06670 [Stetteria hydrogenophila]